MKYIITLLLLIPLFAKCQTTIISVTIQARDLEYIGSVIGGNDIYQDADSSLKSKFRPAFSAPSGTTNVTVGGITNGTWVDIAKLLHRDAFASAGNNSVWGRVDVALRAAANTYLTAQLDADATDFDNTSTANRARGRSRLKHE